MIHSLANYFCGMVWKIFPGRPSLGYFLEVTDHSAVVLRDKKVKSKGVTVTNMFFVSRPLQSAKKIK